MLLGLINARSLQLECVRIFRTVKLDNLRGLLGIRRMHKVPNSWIRQLCRVTKSVDEEIYENVLRWFGHVERMENSKIANRIYVGGCTGSRSMDRGRDGLIP